MIFSMQYLERRECEYDEKTLVNFYKVRFWFWLYSRLWPGVVMFILSSCSYVCFWFLFPLHVFSFNPGRGFLWACFNRSHSVSCLCGSLTLLFISYHLTKTKSNGWNLQQICFSPLPLKYKLISYAEARDGLFMYLPNRTSVFHFQVHIHSRQRIKQVLPGACSIGRNGQVK